jgi:CTP synthase (UTP-ammonia lyase)
VADVPRPSPAVPTGDGLDGHTPAYGIATTGYVQRKADESMAAAVRAKVSSWIGAGVLSGVTLAAVAFAYDKLEDKAADAGEKAAHVQIAPVVEKLEGHEARLKTLEQTSRETQADVHEARGELRDLYKAVMEGKRSERLEKPLPPIPTDGGHP